MGAALSNPPTPAPGSGVWGRRKHGGLESRPLVAYYWEITVDYEEISRYMGGGGGVNLGIQWHYRIGGLLHPLDYYCISCVGLCHGLKLARMSS